MFTLQLTDNSYCIGRVVGFEPAALNSAICAFYMHRIDAVPEAEVLLPECELVSVQFVTRDLLDYGYWQVFCRASDTFPVARYFDLERLREAGFVGIKSVGSGLMLNLMNACYGLAAWDDFHDPRYLDSLLVSPDKKPKNVLLLKN